MKQISLGVPGIHVALMAVVSSSDQDLGNPLVSNLESLVLHPWSRVWSQRSFVKSGFLTSKGSNPMQALQGMAWLLVLQLAGEALAHMLGLPFPGPVVGMLLLAAALQFPRVREPVHVTAGFLLSHLSLLFVPVGVGVITHLDLLRDYGLKLMLVIALSTWVGMGVTVLLVRALMRGQLPDKANKGGATDA